MIIIAAIDSLSAVFINSAAAPKHEAVIIFFIPVIHYRNTNGIFTSGVR
jgi:hypothetical protein